LLDSLLQEKQNYGQNITTRSESKRSNIYHQFCLPDIRSTVCKRESCSQRGRGGSTTTRPSLRLRTSWRHNSLMAQERLNKSTVSKGRSCTNLTLYKRKLMNQKVKKPRRPSTAALAMLLTEAAPA
jgi:hypothetical protein